MKKMYMQDVELENFENEEQLENDITMIAEELEYSFLDEKKHSDKYSRKYQYLQENGYFDN